MNEPLITPEFMTVFTWLMMERERGRRASTSSITKGTGLTPSAVSMTTSVLLESGWLKGDNNGYEITPDGGLAFYALLSGALPPAPGEV